MVAKEISFQKDTGQEYLTAELYKGYPANLPEATVIMIPKPGKSRKRKTCILFILFVNVDLKITSRNN